MALSTTTDVVLYANDLKRSDGYNNVVSCWCSLLVVAASFSSSSATRISLRRDHVPKWDMGGKGVYNSPHTQQLSNLRTWTRKVGLGKLTLPLNPQSNTVAVHHPRTFATKSCTVFCFRTDQVRSEGERNPYLFTPTLPRGRTIGCPCATNTCPMRISTERDP